MNVGQAMGHLFEKYDIIVGMKGNYAFIDGNNLYLGARDQRIHLNYGKMRLYLANKYDVKKAFLFIGYDPQRTDLYSSLQQAGFILIHKPVVIYMQDGARMMKGNVDAELVLHAAAIEYENYDKAVVVTSDGDFACLVKFLEGNDRLEKIITPTRVYSKLLKPYSQFIVPLATIKRNIS